MLFAIAIDALNSLLMHAHRSGVLQRLTTRHAASSISLSADDVVIFCHPSSQDLRAIHELLRVFGEASGLCTNFAKCSATPIQCADPEQLTIGKELSCAIVIFPITYLGIPLLVRKPSAASLQPIIDKLVKQLSTWRATLLSRGERLALVRHVLCAIPTHILVVLALCSPILKQINRFSSRSTGLSVSSFGTVGKRPAVATVPCTGSVSVTLSSWVALGSQTSNVPALPCACVVYGFSGPTLLGLGFIFTYQAIRTPHPFSEHPPPGLLATGTLVISGRIHGSMTRPSLIWHPLFYPLLPGADASLIRWPMGFRAAAGWPTFMGTLTPSAMVQYVHLWRLLLPVSLSTAPDRLSWRWTTDGCYFAKSCYRALFAGSTPPLFGV